MTYTTRYVYGLLMDRLNKRRVYVYYSIISYAMEKKKKKKINVKKFYAGYKELLLNERHNRSK